ncbi:MAG: hypothetical protein ACXU9U_01250, partial [Parachlamydiaceae bacterium]
TLFEICKVQKKLQEKSEDPVLAQHKGVSELVDHLVETRVLAKLRRGDLPLEFSCLRHQQNKEFLSKTINQVLSKDSENKDPLINITWKFIEDQLKITLKAIFAVLFAPKQEHQTPGERRNELINELLNRFHTKSRKFLAQISKIEQMDKKSLKERLEAIQGDLSVQAKELLERAELTWEFQANDFCYKVWGIRDIESDQLIEQLQTWEKEEQENPAWKLSYSTEAKALLSRKELSWEREAIQFLKAITFSNFAEAVLSKELNTPKITDLLPSFLSSDKVFTQLYRLLGDLSLELYDHLQNLESKGKSARAFIAATAEIGALPTFINSVLTSLISGLEKDEGQETIDLGYPFLNQIVTDLLKKSPHDFATGTGKIALKLQVKHVLENILLIVFEGTIREQTVTPDKAFAAILDQLVKKFMEGMKHLHDTFQAVEKWEEAELKSDIVELEKILQLKSKDLESIEVLNLCTYYQELEVKVLSRTLLSPLLPPQVFNQLLPAYFRSSNLWEMIADDELAPYIGGIHEKVFHFRQMSNNSENQHDYRLNSEDREALQPFIAAITNKLIKKLSPIEFKKLLESNEPSHNKIDFTILDSLIGNALQENSQIIQLIQSALPDAIESILAFHLNRIGEQNSQERAATFVWNILETVLICYKGIAAVQNKWAEVDSSSINVDDIPDEKFKVYCKERKIPIAYRKETASPIKTKEACRHYLIWSEENALLSAATSKLMDQVIPCALWVERVPKQFNHLISREKVGILVCQYLEKGFKYWLQQKELATKGKRQIGTSTRAGLGAFIEESIQKAMKNASTPPESDITSSNEYVKGIHWIQTVLSLLLTRENANGDKPVQEIAVSTIYLILGMLLSGELATNKKRFITTLISSIRTTFHDLNRLSRTLELRDHQFSSKILHKYLSVKKYSLDTNEEINTDALPQNFTKSGEKVLFSIPVLNQDNRRNTRAISVNARELMYWNLAYQMIDHLLSDQDWGVYELMQKVLTKEVIAGLAAPYVEMLYQIHAPLQEKAEEVGENKEAEKVGKLDKEQLELKSFIDNTILPNLNSALVGRAKSEKPLYRGSPFLDKLLKDILKLTDEETDLNNVRETLVRQAIYPFFREYLIPKTEQQPAIEASTENIHLKLQAIAKAFKEHADNPRHIAEVVTDILLPEESWNAIFERTKDLMTRDDIVKQLEQPIAKICKKIPIIQLKESLAREQIEKLDRKAGLTARSGGLKRLVETMCQSIDETLDEYATKEEKIFDSLPPLLNKSAQAALKDPILSDVIKDSIHALVSICVARAFEPEKNETPERHVFNVLSKIIKNYDPKDPAKTATLWINELFPEDLRKEILPSFLFNTITPEFLAKNILQEYVAEITAISKAFNQKPFEDILKAKDQIFNFLKQQLALSQDSSRGISGYGGMVKPVERLFVDVLNQPQKSPELQHVHSSSNAFFNQCIEQILTAPIGKRIRDPQFIAGALHVVLPMLKTMYTDTPTDYPMLNEAQLKDPLTLKQLGTDLKKAENESDEGFKQRVLHKHFEIQAAQTTAYMLLPAGPNDLPLPKVAQEATWNQVILGIANQISTFTHRDSRIQFFLNFFGINKKELEALQDELETKGHLNEKQEIVQRLFKEGLLHYTLKTIEKNLASGWSEPLRWIAVQCAKIIAWLAIQLFVNRQLWNFIADPQIDEKLRKVIWVLLSLAKDTHTTVKASTDQLTNTLKDVLQDIRVLKGLHKLAGPKIAALFENQSLVDLLAPHNRKARR